MSRYDWERGEIKLPSAEFAGFRQDIQAADQKRKEKAFALTQHFWKSLTRKQQTDVLAYGAALSTWREQQERAAGGTWPPHPRRPYRPADPADEAALELAGDLLSAKISAWKMVDGRWREDPDHKPTRVLAAEMDYPTNRTTRFTDGEATVIFDKPTNTVVWHSGDNNHQVERARASYLGRAFFDRLAKVRWTHGTGGVLTGNDEYNRDTRDAGYGGNYVTDAYGYQGIAEAPEHVRPFTNARGQQVEVALSMGRYGVVGKAVGRGQGGFKRSGGTGGGQGRVSRGVPTGGQFTTRGRGESGVRL